MMRQHRADDAAAATEEEEALYVLKRSGERQSVQFDKISRRISALCVDPELAPLKGVDATLVAQKVCARIYPGVSTTELDELASQICASMKTDRPAYGHLASRIVISNHQKNTRASFVGTMEHLYACTSVTGEKAPLVSDRLIEVVRAHGSAIESRIVYSRDFRFDYFGFKTLERSYLLRRDDTVVERPQDLWMRVAIGLYCGEGWDAGALQRALQCYDELSTQCYTHATPTLFNSGTPKNQLASCFLLTMQEDSIDGIYDTLKSCAQISKHAGGIGLSVHTIRSTGSRIRGTNGTSNGLVPMLRVFNETARYVDQGGGKRNGSFAIYVEPWHADIFEFLHLKRNHGDESSRARDLFYALWTPDLFMRRLKQGGQWTLFDPVAVPGLCDAHGPAFDALYERYEAAGLGVRTLPAKELWSVVLDSLTETGTPYVLFKDACNRKSNQQNLGTIRSSNLCTEIVEYSSPTETAVCNLASLSLPSVVVPPALPSGTRTVEVHTRDGCPFCLIAIAHLRRMGCHEEGGGAEGAAPPAAPRLTIETYPDNDDGRAAYARRFPDRATFPTVVFDGEVVGGFEELVERTRATVDYEKLDRLTRALVRNLNRTIDTTYYPTEATRTSNMRRRPIGIGVQGLADVLFQLRHPFDSEEAREVNRQVFATMYYAAMSASMELARDGGGAYDGFDTSPLAAGKFQFDLWDDDGGDPRYDWAALRSAVQTHGVRNSLLMAPMPTASTAQILGNTECFEPITSNLYLRRTLAGEFTVINTHMQRDMMDMRLWSRKFKDDLLYYEGSLQSMAAVPAYFRRLYATAWDMSQRAIIDMAADRGRYICQSQSMNLFLAEPNPAQITSMLFYAWQKGLKTGVYYLRTKPRAKAQQFTLDPRTYGAAGAAAAAATDEQECLSCSA